MARVYRLTESDLRSMVERAVRGCLSEADMEYPEDMRPDRESFRRAAGEVRKRLPRRGDKRKDESALRGVVSRAVNEALSEGQGWNKFRDIVRSSNNDDIDMDASLKDMANYVRTGTDRPDRLESGSGSYSAVYDEDGNGMSSLGNDGRPVDTSWRGKVGRAAGLGAGIGYHYGRKGLKAAGKGLKTAGKAVSDAVKDGIRSLERRRLRGRGGSWDDTPGL